MSETPETPDQTDETPAFEIALRVECSGSAEGDLTAVVSSYTDGLRAAVMVETGGTSFRLHGPKALAFLVMVARDAIGFVEPTPRTAADRRSAGF